jgi:hypothetical protein
MSFLMVEQTSETDDANKHVWMFWTAEMHLILQY